MMTGRASWWLLAATAVCTLALVVRMPAQDEATTPARPPSGSDVGPSDPWNLIVERMHQAEVNLRGGDPSESTQQIQQQVVDQLDELLQSLRRRSATADRKAGGAQQGGSGAASQRVEVSRSDTGESGTGKPSSRAGTAPAELRQPEEIAEFHRRLMVEVWGQLPAQLQQRIQSPLHEQFLPQYESLIMDYYRRLAEESSR